MTQPTQKTRKRVRLQTLANDIEKAKRSLNAARRKLASASRPGDLPAFVDPGWRWAAALVQERSRKLLQSANTIGHTVTWRVRNGMPTDEKCVTVFVRRKIPRAQLIESQDRILPRRIGKGGRSIRLDVVELGPLRRHATGGESIGPQTTMGRGTLGSFAVDNATGQVVALTAMHVSGQREIPRPGVTRVPMCVPSRSDHSQAPVFGDIVLGTLSGIDACKIQVGMSATLDDRINGVGRIRGWRPVVVPGDKGTSVRMFGSVSGLRHGVIEHPFVALPEFGLDGAILVNISSRKGDSGAALVDQQNLVLGFLVGAAGGLRVFCPAGMVLRGLACDIPNA